MPGTNANMSGLHPGSARHLRASGHPVLRSPCRHLVENCLDLKPRAVRLQVERTDKVRFQDPSPSFLQVPFEELTHLIEPISELGLKWIFPSGPSVQYCLSCQSAGLIL